MWVKFGFLWGPQTSLSLPLFLGCFLEGILHLWFIFILQWTYSTIPVNWLIIRLLRFLLQAAGLLVKCLIEIVEVIIGIGPLPSLFFATDVGCGGHRGRSTILLIRRNIILVIQARLTTIALCILCVCFITISLIIVFFVWLHAKSRIVVCSTFLQNWHALFRFQKMQLLCFVYGWIVEYTSRIHGLESCASIIQCVLTLCID